MKLKTLSMAVVTSLIVTATAQASISDKPISELTIDDLATPNTLTTSIGTLNFLDGAPSLKTAQKMYDYLDQARAVDAYLKGMPGASAFAFYEGLEAIAPEANQVPLFSDFMDSKSLFLTGNSSTIYMLPTFDLKQSGPMVVDVPEGMLGAFNDAWFRYMEDVGPFGPDKMKGGKFLLLPPDYNGDLPEGYFVVKSPSYRVITVLRASITQGVEEAVQRSKQLKIYPLADKDNPVATEFMNGSGKVFNTLHSNDASYFSHLNDIVQYEPYALLDKETRGLLESVGIKKGKAFNPDQRMIDIYKDAVNVGNAAARSIVWYPRTEGVVDNLKDIQVYPDTDSEWIMGYSGKNVFFTGQDGQTMNTDARVMFHYPYTFTSPAMALTLEGKGSDYAMAYKDENKQVFDGSKTYKLTLPANVPVGNFWAVTLYDNQTRSMLQTDQLKPTVGSNTEGLKQNEDGSYSIYVGPKPVVGYEQNWLQTVPEKGWFMILRMYSPLKPWIDKTWRPSEVMEVK